MKMAEQEFPFNEALGSMNTADKLINRRGEWGELYLCVLGEMSLWECVCVLNMGFPHD